MTEPRRRWTSAEDALLWDLYQVQEKAPTGKCHKINWNEIARHIPNRTNKDCRKRYFNRFTGGLRKGSWTSEEDERLFALVERYQYRWAAIAPRMETRNADQCSKRWHHCLNPELERSPWTDGENALLLSAVGTHGSSWKDIQRCHFPTRSANNIKNQHTILSRKCLSHIQLHPCCGTQSRSSPTSATSTSVSRQISQASSTSSSGLSSSYEAYNYPSLSSTPQMSVTEYEYLPQTPESALGFEFDGSMDGCGYGQYQTGMYPEAEMHAQMAAADPMGMGMSMGYGFQEYQYQGQAYGL